VTKHHSTITKGMLSPAHQHMHRPSHSEKATRVDKSGRKSEHEEQQQHLITHSIFNIFPAAARSINRGIDQQLQAVFLECNRPIYTLK